MVQYIENIIVPYVQRLREDFGDNQSALVIMDNFKGQITLKINNLLETNNINVCLLPANTTDLLQPTDISVNKPAKDFFKRKFERWYSDEVMKQLQGVSDIESAEIEPINICFSAMKVLTSQWLVDMNEYIANNPQFIFNGFRRAGIADALDGHRGDDSDLAEEDEDPLSEESESKDELSAAAEDCPEDDLYPWLEHSSEDEVVGSFSSDSD